MQLHESTRTLHAEFTQDNAGENLLTWPSTTLGMESTIVVSYVQRVTWTKTDYFM